MARAIQEVFIEILLEEGIEMTPIKDKKIKLASDIFNYLTYFMVGVLVTLLYLW